MSNKRSNGEGTITETKNGTYRAQISIDSQRLSKTFKTRIEGARWLRKLTNEAEQGIHSQDGDTIAEFMPHWFQIHQRKCKPNTVDNYRLHIDDYILPYLGDCKVTELSTEMIDKLYIQLEKLGKSSSTILCVHKVLHVALEFAVQRRTILYNPASHAIPPRKPKREMQIFTPEEVRIFLKRAKQSRYEMLYYIAIKTGIRQSELFGLKWLDVNYDQSSLYVRRQLRFLHKGGFTFDEPKSRRSIRAVPIGRQTKGKLQEHESKVHHLSELAGAKWKENNLVFPTRVGTPISQANMNRDFKQILADCNLKNIRFHDLRHTAASIMINAGVPVIQVSHMLGHSMVSITLDTYSHLIPSMHTDTADQIDDFLALD